MLWIGGCIGATLSWPLARAWALRLGLDLIVPFRGYTLEVDRAGVVFDSPPVAGALSLGAEWRFR